MHQRGQRGSNTVKRSMSHLCRLNDGYCGPWVPRLHRRHQTQRLGGGTKVDEDNCSFCGPKKLVQFINKTTFFPLTYKTIAAGRARGSPSSRKIMKNKNNTFPRHPASKLWRITSSGKWQMSFCFIPLPLLHLLTP